jgi:hypothetical protein
MSGRSILLGVVIVALAGGAGLMFGLHLSGLTLLMTVGLAKLTFLASGGLMAGGALLQRLSRREEERKQLDSHTP